MNVTSSALHSLMSDFCDIAMNDFDDEKCLLLPIIMDSSPEEAARVRNGDRSADVPHFLFECTATLAIAMIAPIDLRAPINTQLFITAKKCAVPAAPRELQV